MVQVISKSDPRQPGQNSLPGVQPGGSGSLRWRFIVRTPTWRPPTDVFEIEQAYVVRVEVAGMKEDDFTIELDQNVLSIHGVRADLPERRAYHQMEIYFGEFGIEMELPGTVIANQVQATYQDGFLRVILPKARPRQVQIEVQE
ncbi:MAG: Hsp20/alpha crystallin family protein [Anaerolineales bacterium]|jgi:HSP20 family protein